MKVRVKQQAGAIDSGIACKVEWCNSQGVGFSPLSNTSERPVADLESLGFRVQSSFAFPGVFICPWESADGGDCYLCVLP